MVAYTHTNIYHAVSMPLYGYQKYYVETVVCHSCCKTSISLLKLYCTLQKEIHFHSRKMNIFLFTIYKSISHTCKRNFQECSSIVSWRHILDYIIRLITQISNPEIVVKIAVVLCCYMLLSWEYFSYQNKDLICFDSICIEVN